VNGVQTLIPASMSIPTYQLITPGGDTQLIGNFEYRIPIFARFTLALFLTRASTASCCQRAEDESRKSGGLERDSIRKLRSMAVSESPRHPDMRSSQVSNCRSAAGGSGPVPRLLGLQSTDSPAIFAAADRGGPVQFSRTTRTSSRRYGFRPGLSFFENAARSGLPSDAHLINAPATLEYKFVGRAPPGLLLRSSVREDYTVRSTGLGWVWFSSAGAESQQGRGDQHPGAIISTKDGRRQRVRSSRVFPKEGDVGQTPGRNCQLQDQLNRGATR